MKCRLQLVFVCILPLSVLTHLGCSAGSNERRGKQNREIQIVADTVASDGHSVILYGHPLRLKRCLLDSDGRRSVADLLSRLGREADDVQSFDGNSSIKVPVKGSYFSMDVLEASHVIERRYDNLSNVLMQVSITRQNDDVSSRDDVALIRTLAGSNVINLVMTGPAVGDFESGIAALAAASTNFYFAPSVDEAAANPSVGRRTE